MKKLSVLIAGVAVLIGITGSLLSPPVAIAQSPADQILQGAGRAANPANPTANVSDSFAKIVNVILFIVGAIAVIMIIIGGIRYVMSGGEASSLTAAKNTILYAVVGLIIAMLAFAIVNFVAKSFQP